jgi:hypothetical protein
MVPSEGRLVDLSESETASLVGVLDVRKVLVIAISTLHQHRLHNKLTLLKLWKLHTVSQRECKTAQATRDAHALLPPAVLFAAAMAKLCPDGAEKVKSLVEGLDCV